MDGDMVANSEEVLFLDHWFFGAVSLSVDTLGPLAIVWIFYKVTYDTSTGYLRKGRFTTSVYGKFETYGASLALPLFLAFFRFAVVGTPETDDTGAVVGEGVDLTMEQRLETTLHWFLVMALPSVYGARQSLKESAASCSHE
jgi:hypothetical protein